MQSTVYATDAKRWYDQECTKSTNEKLRERNKVTPNLHEDNKLLENENEGFHAKQLLKYSSCKDEMHEN